MPQFRKKPVVIEAVQWNGPVSGFGDDGKAPDWLPRVSKELDEYGDWVFTPPGAIWRKGDTLWIGTNMGPQEVNPGDWIVFDGADLDAFKPDAFLEQHDPA